jgi:tetratricopeptide (TPR) repeat protein
MLFRANTVSLFPNRAPSQATARTFSTSSLQKPSSFAPSLKLWSPSLSLTTLHRSPALIFQRSFCEATEFEGSPKSPEAKQFLRDMHTASTRRLPQAKVEEIFQSALAKGLPKDEFSLGVYMETAARLKNAPKVGQLWGEFQALGLDTTKRSMYNIRLNVAILLRQWSEADKILEEMTAKGIAHNRRTYNHRIQLAAARGDDQLVQAIRGEMRRNRVKPNAHIIAALIEHAGNGGKLAEIDYLLGELNELGEKPNITVATAVLEGFLKNRQWNTVAERFEKFKETMRPTSYMYGLLLEALAKLRNLDRVEAVIQEIERNNVYQTADMKAQIADAYQRSGDFDKAWGILSQIQNKTSDSLRISLATCGAHQKPELIDELVSTIEQNPKFARNMSMWAWAINAYMRAGAIARAAKVMFGMREKGLAWDGRHRSAFIGGLKMGDFPEGLTASVQHLGMSKERSLPEQEIQELEQVLQSVS